MTSSGNETSMTSPDRHAHSAFFDTLSQIARTSDDPAQKVSAAVIALHRYVVAIADRHAGKPCFSARMSARLFSLARELQTRRLGASAEYEALYMTAEQLACDLAAEDYVHSALRRDELGHLVPAGVDVDAVAPVHLMRSA
jgi:hypothetical protein